MKSKVVLTVIISIFAFSSLIYGDVPQMINYQGKITTPAGALVDTTVQMTFTIYDDSTTGNVLWADTQSTVVVEKGVFSVLLGSGNPIPDSVFDGNVRYLGTKVGTDSEMSPRKAMVSVPYAFRTGGDGDWTFRITDTADTTLMTGGEWGITRYGNVLYGNADSTHVNLGVACTTGRDVGNDKYCTVGGGLVNSASWDYATVCGGAGNTAFRYYSAVGGGLRNTASSQFTTIGGGKDNIASDLYATVGGGWENDAGEHSAVVGGGRHNTASHGAATIGGGDDNTSSNDYATIGGGRTNTASGYAATVGGGTTNIASNTYATIGGGRLNSSSGMSSTVGGGDYDSASGGNATVGGGNYNKARGNFSTVGGGSTNQANGYCATVAGGQYNVVSGASDATVGGGSGNVASGSNTTVSGGFMNTASYGGVTVGGGEYNMASGYRATIPGGYADTVAGDYSLGAGRDVTITSDASFTFAFGRDFTTLTPNAVVFSHPSAATRMGINVTNPTYAITLPNNANNSGRGMANAWNTYSSIRWKENISQIDNALDKVLALRGVYFDWKQDKTHDIGLIAEEVGEVIPEVVTYDKNGVDAEGLNYASLTALLVEAVKEQQKEIEALKTKINALEGNR